MNEQDTTPAYDIYVEEDRVTFVRRPEPTVESDLDVTVTSGLRFVPIVMLTSHGLIALLALALAAYLTLAPATAEVYALASGVPALARVYALPAITMSKSKTVSTTGRVHVPASQATGKQPCGHTLSIQGQRAISKQATSQALAANRLSRP